MMNRQEHLDWCKKRALEYAEQGDCVNAVASMLSDMSKHEETDLCNPFLMQLGMLEIQRGPEAFKRWINGFN